MENLMKQVSDHEIRIRENETKSAKMEVRMDTAEKKIDNLEVIKDAVIEISATLKHMKEDNVKRDQFYKEQSETLQELTLEIKAMNVKIDDTGKDLADLKEKVDDNIKNGTVSFNGLFKKFGIAAIGGIVTLFFTWLGIKFGIKK